VGGEGVHLRRGPRHCGAVKEVEVVQIARRGFIPLVSLRATIAPKNDDSLANQRRGVALPIIESGEPAVTTSFTAEVLLNGEGV
jgi:hypothetical protein